jgi:ribosomal protein S18 acetylase RimI-like enzyme
VVRKSQPQFMQSDDHPAVSIRAMAPADRTAVAEIILSVGNFNRAEIGCALELIDIYLRDRNQKDYRIVVAECRDGRIGGYACWGPIPLTVGGYDLYWIATHPSLHGQGSGRALMDYVEDCVREDGGRLLVLETSSKESYRNTVRFYRRLNYEEELRIHDFYDVGDDKLVLVKRFSG